MLGDLNSKGYKSVAMIKWGKNEETLDIRRFSQDGVPMKGISTNHAEAVELFRILKSEENIDRLFDEGPVSTAATAEEEPKRQAVNLYEILGDVEAIHHSRKRGYVTIDGRIELKFKKEV